MGVCVCAPVCVLEKTLTWQKKINHTMKDKICTFIKALYKRLFLKPLPDSVSQCGEATAQCSSCIS